MKPEKTRGLIFASELIPGVMRGEVTVTTRIMKPQPDGVCQDEAYWHVGGFRLREGAHNPLRCPFRAGERRYVKEAWYCDARGGLLGYPADGDCPHGEPYRIGNPMYMPKALARTWIETTGVKPARCQEITEEEAIASGCAWGTFGDRPEIHRGDATDDYRYLWDRLNARRGFPWSANCWVWRCTFRLTEAPC